MVKILTKNVWTPVDLSGALLAGSTEGLVGIEECTDYELNYTTTNRKNSKSKPVDKIENNDSINPKSKPIKKAKKKKKKNKTKVTPEIKNELKTVEVDTKKKKTKNSKKEVDVPSKALKTINQNDGWEQEEVVVENVEKKMGMEAWHIVPLPKTILDALEEQKFYQPTEIQTLTLPSAINGKRDILGAAETGSGKTLAFGLPILCGILKLKEKAEIEMEIAADNVEKDREDDSVNMDAEHNPDDDLNLDTDEENSDNEADEESDLEVDSDEENIQIDSDAEDIDEEQSDDEEHQQNEGSDESDFEETEEDVDELGGAGIGCVRVINNVDLGIKLKARKPFYALILTPTRELAVQIKNHLVTAAKNTGIYVAVVVGGMAAVKQERVLNKGPEIVVATPGRLWELIQQGQPHLMQLEDIRYLAIDETDRMIEKGHFKELHHILDKLNINEQKKKLRQNFVFSATLTMVHELPNHLKTKKKIMTGNKIAELTPSQKLKRVVGILGITNPKVVDITKGKGTSGTLTECRIICSIDEKDYYVYYFLQRHPGRTLIFCNSIGCVKRLATLLGLLGCNPLPLHASMQQRQRLKNLDRFRDKPNSILVATDVAARGLDIPSVEHVLHYQTPRTSESYVHRSGRTARASKEGITVLLVERNELHNYVQLCRTLGKTEDIPLFPVHESSLNAVKQRVNLARELDKIDLQVKKANSEAGWFSKVAEDMDIIIDDNAFKYDIEEAKGYKKTADFKRKQLLHLTQTPVFPKGFSGKYPQLYNTENMELDSGTLKSESAIDIMKREIEENSKSKKKRRRQKKMFNTKIFTEEKINAKELVKKDHVKNGKKNGRFKNGNKQGGKKNFRK